MSNINSDLTGIVVSKGREALSRAVRQAIQSLIPTFVVVAAGSTYGIDVKAVAILAGLTALVSLLKSAANLKVGASQPVWAQILDRAVTAAAGTALSLITVDGTVPNTSIDTQAVVTATIGAAVLAVAMFYTNPPVVTPDEGD